MASFQKRKKTKGEYRIVRKHLLIIVALLETISLSCGAYAAQAAQLDTIHQTEQNITTILQTTESPHDTTNTAALADAISFGEAAVSFVSASDVKDEETIQALQTQIQAAKNHVDAAAEEHRVQQFLASAQAEVASHPGMVGRLYVPSAGINVGLYSAPMSSGTANMQAVTDAADSCAYISGAIPGAILLADHNTQAFSSLTSIGQGTTGYIIRADRIEKIVATTVMNGHNNGNLADSNMNPLGAIAPYIAYTCMSSWQNVRIVGFTPIN